MSSDRRNGLVVSATGTGKTVVMTELIKSLPEKKILVCAHRKELLEQISNYLPQKEWQIIKQCDVDTKKRIHIASIQSLVTKKERYKSLLPDIIITDECHRSETEQYKKLFSYFSSVKKIGFTATPIRDGEESQIIFDKFWGDPIFSFPFMDAMKQGYLTPYMFHCFEETIDLSKVKNKGNDFDEKSLEIAINHKERTSKIVSFHKQIGIKKCIAFCSSISHCENVMEEYKEQAPQICCYLVTGETPPEKRKMYLQEYKEKEKAILINCQVLVEGFDAPSTSQIAMFCPTKSPKKYIQAIGRGTRLAEGKSYCDVIDSNTTIVESESIFSVLATGKSGKDYRKDFFAFEDNEKINELPMTKIDCKKILFDLGGKKIFEEKTISAFLSSHKWEKEIIFVDGEYISSEYYRGTPYYVGKYISERKEKKKREKKGEKTIIFSGEKTILDIKSLKKLEEIIGKKIFRELNKKVIFYVHKGIIYISPKKNQLMAIKPEEKEFFFRVGNAGSSWSEIRVSSSSYVIENILSPYDAWHWDKRKIKKRILSNAQVELCEKHGIEKSAIALATWFIKKHVENY